MKNKKELLSLLFILLISTTLRFYNLMHDAQYFFDPDERNMANAISQFRLPSNISQIPICLISQISPILKNDPGSSSRSNDPGSPPTNCNLNPHFFSYGQFPLYLSFLSDQIIRAPLAVLQGVPLQTYLQTSFPSSIFWLRFWSAVASVFTVLFVYLITKQITNNYMLKISNFKFQISNLAALSAAFTPGLIQSAHFGTTESLLTFLFLTSIYLSLSYLSDLRNLKFVILTSLTIGLALGSKLTGIFFLIPPVSTLIIRIIEVLRKRGKAKVTLLLSYFVILCIIFIGSTFFFILSSPYNLVEPESFKSAVFGYEHDVATGRYEAFYTRQFVNTVPLLFQVEKIFPYALGWPVFILGTLGFLLMNLQLILYLILPILRKYQISNIKYQINRLKNKKIFNILYVFFIFDLSFLIYLIPNASLFAKWTRFMTPIFPFFAIFAGYAVFLIYKVIDNLVGKAQSSKLKAQSYNLKLKTLNFKLWFYALRFTLYALIILPGIAFMSIYTHEDTRVTASKWIYGNIPQNSYILSETANVVDIPVGLKNTPGVAGWSGNESHDSPGVKESVITKNYEVISFDFYHLDENPNLFKELLTHLEKSDYIFIPSRRIFVNYTKLPQIYPLVTKYYQLLFSGALGFEKITEISSFPKLQIGNWKLKIDDEHSEETYTAFDHPVVRIYRKVKPLTIDEYRSLFEC